jgi:hypothetical protein
MAKAEASGRIDYTIMAYMVNICVMVIRIETIKYNFS